MSGEVAVVKKAVFWLIVGFAIFYIWAEPTDAARIVRAVFDFILQVFRSIITFFTALAR